MNAPVSFAATHSPVHVSADFWRSARRILCVRLDALGDVLMTTPAFRALKQSGIRGRRLTLLTSDAGAALAPYVPEIDECLSYAAPWMKHAAPPPAEAMRDLIDTLRAGAFDAAVIFTVYSQSALPAAMLCWQAGIPLRLAHVRENPYHLLSDWEPEREPEQFVRHETRRQLDLVASVGCSTDDDRLSFRLTDSDVESANAKLREAGVDLHAPWMIVHPGASAESRRYPPEYFQAAVFDLMRNTGLQIVITGNEQEQALVESVAANQARVWPLAGRLSLGELAVTIARAKVLIANNTGPAHLAAALGTPVVDLYALTNPQHRPWRVAHRVLYADVPCRFCYRSVCVQGHHQCLRGVPPAAVSAAAQALLSEAPATRADSLLPQD